MITNCEEGKFVKGDEKVDEMKRNLQGLKWPDGLVWPFFLRR